MIDVAIVGGGPAGLLSGLLLAEAGVEATIFEEHAGIGARAAAGGDAVSASTLAAREASPENLRGARGGGRGRGRLTKPTTGGGIFYSLLTATLAVQTLLEGFRVGRFDDEVLSVYERRWNDRLGQELRIAEWLRGMAAKCTDGDIDALIHAMASDDVRALIRTTAKFNWHRDLIVAMLRQRGIKALLVRALFR